MKKILHASLNLLLAALMSLSFVACGSDDTQPVSPTPENRPVDAGLIMKTELEDGSVLLSVGEIFYAETYRWYRDGQEVQCTASREYLATVSGTYKVAGVNSVGEGRPSPEVKVLVGDDMPGFELRIHTDKLTPWSVLFDVIPEDTKMTYYYDIISKARWEQTDLKSYQQEIDESIHSLAEFTDTSYEETLQGILNSGDLLNVYNGAGFRPETEFYLLAFYWDKKGPSDQVVLQPFTTPAVGTSTESLTLSFEAVEPFSMTLVCDPSVGVVDYYLYFDETTKAEAMLASLEDENAFLSYHAMNVGTHLTDMQTIQRQGLKPETSYTALALAIDERGERFMVRADQVTPAEEQRDSVDSELFTELLGTWRGVQTLSDPYSGSSTTEFTVTIVSEVADLEYDFRAKNQLVAQVDGWYNIGYYGVAALREQYEGMEDTPDPLEAYGPKWLLNVAEGDKVTIDGCARNSVIGWLFMGNCYMTNADPMSGVVHTTHDLQVEVSEDRNTIIISAADECAGCYPALSYYFEGLGWMIYIYGGSDIVLTRAQ